ncbi:unnamed protein product [Acanthoscelides obtectus]|uniref:RING-CH-type domain-containing protein n=1 Tax=Acanthoscelides obtectus TaxID=200917 RepID=A0A9P0L116_ACAOB|nr:unnamed protein product [Acanthoscelides obtectus]CAK1631970.1 E3 ubiquitin-protein ligase MARCH3 [Acanthoscelides obtectus]
MSEEIRSIHSGDNLEPPRSHKKYSVHKFPSKKSASKVHSVGSLVCRICHTNTVNEGLISPCNCKGSLAYVHLSCLERWLNQSSRSYCELCMYRYSAIETKRYKLCEGIRLWIKHPRNMRQFKSDLVIASLLTLVTSGLIASSLFGMEYFVIEGSKVGLQRKWIRLTICLFLLIVMVGYLITIYLIARDQLLPWYRWWTKTVDIRLLLPPSICMKMLVKKREGSVQV